MTTTEPQRKMLAEALWLEGAEHKPEWFAPNISVARALARRGLVTVRLIGQRWWRIQLTRAGRDLARTRIHDAATAGLVQCGNCDVGFRRVDGIHVGSQRLGMIPNTPCNRIFAVHEGGDTARPWIAYVDGEPLHKQGGEARRFATATAAYDAARKASPRRWHP